MLPRQLRLGNARAHPEQMENLIQLFLWLQVSARLTKARLQAVGRSLALQHPTEGRVPRGWDHARLRRRSFRNPCELEIACEGMRKGEGWKTIASGVRKHPGAGNGSCKQSAKSGGRRCFIPLGTLGAKGLLNVSLFGYPQHRHTPGLLQGHIPKEDDHGQDSPEICIRQISPPVMQVLTMNGET